MKTVLITGATSGMGKYIARQFAAQGMAVLLHGRNTHKLNELVSQLKQDTGNNNIRAYAADFSSLKQVHAMAQEILAKESRLEVLINNAGIGGGTPTSGREISQDGYELRFAVNYLAPYLLTRELLPLLAKSAPARIVNVASVGQQAIDFSDVMLERGYGKMRAYAQSKLALIMFTFDIAIELRNAGVTATALHPATFMNTKMVRESWIPPINRVQDGAKPTMWLAVAPETQGMSGKYFDQFKETRAAPQAYDMAARAQLKQLSDELIARILHR